MLTDHGHEKDHYSTHTKVRAKINLPKNAKFTYFLYALTFEPYMQFEIVFDLRYSHKENICQCFNYLNSTLYAI